MGGNSGNNEYYMPREYYDEPKEYPEPAREHTWAVEYTETAEHTDRAEYFDTPQSVLTDPAGKDKGRRGKIRKMVYLLTAAVAAVTVAQAAIPEQTLSMIPVGQYNAVGYADGGVIPVEDSKGWHLLNLDGENIHDVGKNSKMIGKPNEEGRIAFRIDSHHYVVLDRNGREIWSYDSEDMATYHSDQWDNIYISDQNYMVLAMRDWSHCIFADDKGNIIFDDIQGLSMNQCAEFSDGYAVIFDKETDTISLLGMDGSLTEVYEKNPEHHNEGIQIIDGYSDGTFIYFVRGDYVLYDPATRQGTLIPRGLSEEEAAFLGGVQANYIINYVRFDGEWVYGGVPTTTFKRYYKNNVSLAHKGTFYCQTYSKKDEATGQWHNQDFLFDVSRRSDVNPLGVVANYDTIYFDDSQYLLVCQDGEYFYIDWDGNVVSKRYTKATTFSEQGYAVVMNQEGWAYVIDEDLKQVDRIADVTDLEPKAKGDIFVVSCGDETFVCFYGEKE